MLPARVRDLLLSRGKTIVSRNRRRGLVRRLAHYNSTFKRWYENFDVNFYSNGEHFVLKSLEGCGFKTIFDVGANVGDWTLMARQIFPDAEVHAFEIVGQTYETLKRRTAGVPDIVLNEFGLSDADGEIAIKFFPGADALATATDYPHSQGHVTVAGRTVRGDAYVEEKQIERIDFLKIDVEGMENLVLEGLRETFEAGKVSVVQFEYGTVNILTGFLLHDFYEFFVSRGYRVGKIYPNYVEFRDYKFEHEDFIGPNFLAVSAARPGLIERLS